MRPRPAKPDPDHRRVLDLLAGSRDGSCPEALRLAAHGVTAGTIEALINAGHVVISTTHMRAGGRQGGAGAAGGDHHGGAGGGWAMTRQC